MAHTAKIRVVQPRFWWRVPVSEAQRFAPADPDFTGDGVKFRWHDRAEQRWELIAEAVSSVSKSLASGNWIAPTDYDPALDIVWGEIPFDPNAQSLTPTEFKIVQAWFGKAERVRTDPWRERVEDGRHRLWLTLQNFREEHEPIPIYGNELSNTTPENAAALGDGYSKHFETLLKDLAEVSWFEKEDPVNRRYIKSIEAAAAGHFPLQL